MLPGFFLQLHLSLRFFFNHPWKFLQLFPIKCAWRVFLLLWESCGELFFWSDIFALYNTWRKVSTMKISQNDFYLMFQHHKRAFFLLFLLYAHCGFFLHNHSLKRYFRIFPQWSNSHSNVLKWFSLLNSFLMWFCYCATLLSVKWNVKTTKKKCGFAPENGFYIWKYKV